MFRYKAVYDQDVNFWLTNNSNYEYIKNNRAQTTVAIYCIKAGPSCFMTPVTASILPPKEFKTNNQLVEILEFRGMAVKDRSRAERKLAQIGYYRLSGFWYPCRSFGAFDISTRKERRGDLFQPNIDFDLITELYLFDKKLRQLMMDAIERIEVHIRSVMAQYLGELNQLAYEDVSFVNPRYTNEIYDKRKRVSKKSKWENWQAKHQKCLSQGRKQASIAWHHKCGRAIPIWVATETWDFGCISMFFEILKQSHKRQICNSLSILPKEIKVFEEWLRHISLLRNRCAHHGRIWNQTARNPIPFLSNTYFDSLNLSDDTNPARYRIFGLICVLWYLVKSVGPSSNWIENVAKLIDSKPKIDSCPFTAMGFADNSGFPRDKFGLA